MSLSDTQPLLRVGSPVDTALFFLRVLGVRKTTRAVFMFIYLPMMPHVARSPPEVGGMSVWAGRVSPAAGRV